MRNSGRTAFCYYHYSVAFIRDDIEGFKVPQEDSLSYGMMLSLLENRHWERKDEGD